MGREAIAKGASVILGPTVNMQRSPLGGRGFESYSEEPVLAGDLAAAIINGIQSTGVAATLKHFVCNDQEHERMAVNSILTERALREIYLKPFQIAQRDAKPWAYMTSYNQVNGVHASEDPRLLKDVLRGEWAFDGLTMSDWYGTYSTTDAIKAGLDLEMPGPSYIRARLINQALRCGKLHEHDLDLRAREVLKLVKKVLPLKIPENAEEKKIDSPETAALLRKIAADSIVLMKNEKGILPLKKDKTTAVIGPNANFAAYCGGGSASLLPYYAISPLEGIKKHAADVKYELGAPGWNKIPLLSRLSKDRNGKAGAVDLTIYREPSSDKSRKPIDHLTVTDTFLLLADYKNSDINSDLWYADVDCTITPEITAEYEFSVSVAGTAKLYLDDKLVVDNATKQVTGDSFFGVGTREEKSTISLEGGKSYKVHVDFGTLPTMTVRAPGATSFGAGGLRLGFERKVDIKSEIEKAVKLAKKVDQVVICGGLNSDWESEGYDRDHMDLPPGSDELIEAVIAANPNTVVVIQSGTPVTMPWVAQAPALLQAWYGGNETGNAIADVVFGKMNPNGKLPLSFPVQNEDNPAFLNFKSEAQRAIYGEDVYIGYRFYEKTKKAVAFPFGHGLSYTTFSLSSPSISVKDDALTVSVQVQNTGDVAGAQVVQVYVSQHSPSINRPPKELKGFAKVFVEAGSQKKAEITTSLKYATSYWDENRDSWVSEKGKYSVLIGDSSADTPLKVDFEVRETFWWKGL